MSTDHKDHHEDMAPQPPAWFAQWLLDRMEWHAKGMQGSGDPDGHARRFALYRIAADVLAEYAQEDQP